MSLLRGVTAAAAAAASQAPQEVAGAAAGRGFGGGAGARGQERLQQQAVPAPANPDADANADAGPEEPVWDMHVPITTLRTPRAVLQRRLLSFDRDQHLSASIITHAQQVLC